jgi:hypothetical protein
MAAWRTRSVPVTVLFIGVWYVLPTVRGRSDS